ncbi:MAG: hypothetical protein H7196_00280, partial [candidate division SR1 bacterium]|nr:hypothetical protein [candidate division SR1 bacterium]
MTIKKLLLIFASLVIGIALLLPNHSQSTNNIFRSIDVSAGTAPSSFLPKDTVICGGTPTDSKNACQAIGGESNITGATGLTGLLISIARLITYISGGLAVLFLVYGGVRYLTASDEKAVGTARQIIQNAIIGLVIAILAFA